MLMKHITMHIDTLFDSLKSQVSQGEQKIELSVPASWTQGRTLYGGISASLVYQAMREVINSDVALRSLNTNFVGPIEANKHFTITTEILREGKNVTQVMGRLVQDDKIAVVSQASFGQGRQSKIAVPNTLEHKMEPAGKPAFIPAIPKITPKFLTNFQLSKTKGGWPFTGKKECDTHGWMRFKKAPHTLTDAHLVALIDVWPPTVLQLLRWPAAASTVNWNLEFIHPHQSIEPCDWLAYQANTRQASDGYAHTEANIWDSHGSLIAISRQTVAVFG